MDATEICSLSQEALTHMLSVRQECQARRSHWHGRRSAPRWPFPSTVELWLPEERGVERYLLATSINLSTTGIGLKVDEELPKGLELGIAIHEPEMSFHGRAVVRHCAETERGYWIAGLEFLFDKKAA
jgi:hypothetical protein